MPYGRWIIYFIQNTFFEHEKYGILSVPFNVSTKKKFTQIINSNNIDLYIPKQLKAVDKLKNINVNIPKNVNVNIPQNINVNILFKNNNQSSVPVKVYLNKQPTQIFKRDKVYDHVSTNNNDVGILR